MSTNSASEHRLADTSRARPTDGQRLLAETSEMKAAPARTEPWPTLVPRDALRHPFTTFPKILVYLVLVSVPGAMLAVVVAALSFFFLLVFPLIPFAALMRVVAIGLTRWQNRWGLNTWPRLHLLKFAALYSPTTATNRPDPATNRPAETFIIRSWRLLSSADFWRTIVWSLLELTISVIVVTVLTFWLAAAGFGTLSIPIESAHPGAVRLDFPDPFNGLWFTTTIGIFALLTLYPVTVGLFALMNAPFLILIYPFRSRAALEQRAANAERQLEHTAHQRDSAMATESRQLRQLERNLHDGPQQLLVRTTLDIAMARRKLALGETDAAVTLLDQASAHANSSLSELRLLVRGFGPAALQEHGLPLALEDLAAACAIPVTVEGNLAGKESRFPTPAEQGLYFVAAEALTNAVKHAQASRATLQISTQKRNFNAQTQKPNEAPSSEMMSNLPGFLASHLASNPETLSIELTISDNGHGGAQVIPGHGLAGLADRMEALGGTLNVTSDNQGTTVKAQLDVTAAQFRQTLSLDTRQQGIHREES